MLFQTEKYDCAAFALANAYDCMGFKIPVSRIARVAGTTEVGTTHYGLLQAIEVTGFRCHELQEMTYAVAEERLLAHLRSFPAILCTQNDDHWVTALGLSGKRVIVFDSENSAANRKVGGVYVLNLRQFRKYWTAGIENFRYSLLILPPEKPGKGTKK